jgi:hypothetical protein
MDFRRQDAQPALDGGWLGICTGKALRMLELLVIKSSLALTTSTPT